MLGLQEIVLIGFVAVLLIWGPKRLPEWGRFLASRLKKRKNQDDSSRPD